MAAKTWSGQNGTGSQGLLRSTTNATANRCDSIPVEPGDRTFVLHALTNDIHYAFHGADNDTITNLQYGTVVGGTKESIPVRGLAYLLVASTAGGDGYVIQRDGDEP